MDRDPRAVSCIELKGHARRQWWKLTREEVDRLDGDREILIGRLQERFGRKVEKWFRGDVGRP